MINRRLLLQSTFAASLTPAFGLDNAPPRRILLRSSWQTVNIGEIAHTPGMLTLLEKHRPHAEVTLWPSRVDRGVEEILRVRFPKLRIAKTKDEREAALAACDFFLHGSGPGLPVVKEASLAQKMGKPYGFGGITLNDQEIKERRKLLEGAKFVFLRDSDSLRALQASGVTGPRLDFGPDATFAIDLRDDAAAAALLKQYDLTPGEFLCAIPRLRWTPYWEIHPDTVKPNADRIAENEKFAELDHAKLREGIIAWVRGTNRRVLLAAGVPSVLLRQPTDSRKGRMWYDLKMDDWVFEIDKTTGAQVAACVMKIAADLPAARGAAAKANALSHEKMIAMIAAIG